MELYSVYIGFRRNEQERYAKIGVCEKVKAHSKEEAFDIVWRECVLEDYPNAIVERKRVGLATRKKKGVETNG